VKIVLPIAEALSLVTSMYRLPAMVSDVHGESSTMHATIDPRHLADASGAMRLAAQAAGSVAVAARFAGYADGVATFTIAAQARGLPAHRLVNLVSGRVNGALRRRGLPEGLVEVRKGEGEPILALHLQRAIDAKIEGVTLTGFEFADGTALVEATVGEARLR
jgi:hypothetical protein